MRKLVQIISAALLSVAFIGVTASAQVPSNTIGCDDIVINNSGNDSENNVTCETVTETTITCTNNIIVGNVNFQGGESGEGSAEGNNGTGSVKAGTVVNYNGTQTTVGAACGASTTTSPSPSVSPSPSTTPGAGGAGAAGAVKPAALPYTASNSTLAVVIMSLAAAAAVVAGSRVAVALYRRVSNK